jgi:galactose oxidase
MHDGDHMPMIEPNTPDAFTPKLAPLAAAGWTASASDQSPGYPASNVVDGNTATFWHSLYSPVPAPLPHSVTIDLKGVRSVSGVGYVPRQDGNPNGRVGRYSVTTSTDGAAWSEPVVTGTWNDDERKKTAVFPPVLARYVQLTAHTEAGGRGPWSSAAEIEVIGAPAAGPPLPRSGWTATASDASPSYPARNVLDGNGTTIWHTVFGAGTTPLPHTLTVDMGAPATVTGLRYLPRQDASRNGTIGRYTVSVNTDGTSWGTPVATGQWTDDPTPKTATFTAVSARYVRLTALSEAGGRGPWSSATEIDVLGVAPGPGSGGIWDPPVGLPIVPVSAAVLPGDRLLTFAAYDAMNFSTTGTVTRVCVVDLATRRAGQTLTVNTQHEMFCTGLAMLSDGRLLVNGGSSDSATTIYDPATNTWIRGPLMKIPRAYEGDTLLSSGQVFTLGGSWRDRAGFKDGELFTPSGTTGTWSRLPGVTASAILTADPGGVYRADNHAWLFAWTGNTVFHAGPSRQMHWITTTGNGTITSAGPRSDSADAMNGNAVMYDVGKILTVGGATAYQDVPPTAVNTQATRRAYVVDITAGPGGPVTTTRSSDMAYARAFCNSVVLPDGSVLVVGGQQHPQGFTDTGAVLSPELWNPATGTFTVLAPDVIPRTYHSVAVLLPDGRVFSGGGGLCGSCTVNHPDGRIFTPPYLLQDDGTPRTRLVLTAAPSTASPGASISVTTDAPAASFALVRTSAVTHGVNNDQRRIPLTAVAASGTTSTLVLPADRGILLPGPYLLFALDAAGTPSVARLMTIV